MLSPLVSEADPVASSEGSIDPLGMAAIAENLAVRLVPGVRERQSHPRYLTAIAASTVVCSAFDEDMVATDEVSEPWQVFEWYMVEGLVRQLEVAEIRGLPGRFKAEQAIRDEVPLSAPRYLKTPRVFGFHGVYRVLAQDLDIVDGGRLGEFGYELVQAWAREQGLEGFAGSADGPGQQWRRLLMDAVTDGLAQGAVARKGGWQGWSFFTEHLAPYVFGNEEAKLIARALAAQGHGYRDVIVDFLVSSKGQETIRERDYVSERSFHAALLPDVHDELRGLLEAIMAYEQLARLLQDAFDDCLYAMTMKRGRTYLPDLTSLPCITPALERVPALYQELIGQLSPYGQVERFRLTFEDVADALPLEDWIERLLSHHQMAQRRKPPGGKSPWFERFDDGSYVIRPGYRRYEGGRRDQEYAHGYRTVPLWSFAQDLGLVES